MKTQYYKGFLITYKCGHYWTLGTLFKSLKAAKKLIDATTV